MAKKFQRAKEDFNCQQCEREVKGDGYTNHCPNCLWSKHVDVHPGDRAETCKGMMEPIGVESKGDEYVITHRCVICGDQKRNRVAPNDSSDAIIRLSSRPTT